MPVVKIGDVLVASIQADISDETTLALREDLSQQIVATEARGVIIDIGALDVVDTFIGRMLSTIASMSQVLDATTIVVGMRPAVAITLAELGLSLPGVRTALNSAKAFEILKRAQASGAHDRNDAAYASFEAAD